MPLRDVRSAVMPSLGRVVVISRPVLWINALGTGVVAMWLAGSLWTWAALPMLLWLCLPFNLLIYGVNDIYDQDTDAQNPRKASLEGARIAAAEVPGIWAWVIGLNAPFVLWFAITLPAAALAWMALYVVVFVAYSAPPLRFKARPYLDAGSNAAYALPMVFVPLALGTSPVWPAALGLMAWSVAKHPFDAVQDIEEDRQVGIATTAVRLGPTGTGWWCALWWGASTLGFALVNLPVAAVNLLIAGGLVAVLLRSPSPATARRLYRYSIAFPYVAGSVAGVQLTIALYLGWYP